MRGRADGAMEERTGRRMDEGHFLTPVTPVGYLGKRDRVRKKKNNGEKRITGIRFIIGFSTWRHDLPSRFVNLIAMS